jgi:hypothetical protein
LKLRTHYREVLICESTSQSSEESEKAVKIFYSDNSIYRGEGGVLSRTRLDPTVARFPEDSSPLLRSKGDVFY